MEGVTSRTRGRCLAAAKREAWKEEQPIQVRNQELKWARAEAERESAREKKRQAEIVEAVAQAVLDKVAMEEVKRIREEEGAVEEMEVDCVPETQLEKECCHEAGERDLEERKAMKVDCSWGGDSGKISEEETAERCTGDAAKPIIIIFTPDESEEDEDAMNDYRDEDDDNEDKSSIADENDRIDALDLMDEALMVTENDIDDRQWERLARAAREDADMEDVAEEVILAEFKEVVKRKREKWDQGEGRETTQYNGTRTIKQWKRAIPKEAVKGLLASKWANKELETRREKERAERPGVKEGRRGRQGGGQAGPTGKGKSRSARSETSKETRAGKEASRKLGEAEKRISNFERQLRELIKYMRVQWNRRNQGIAPLSQQAPRAPPPAFPTLNA